MLEKVEKIILFVSIFIFWMCYVERKTSDVDFATPKNGERSEDKGVHWEDLGQT